ncbi:ferredoxin reductase [Streptomyces sp. SID6673]|nr:ferredoxin reductase [Streptomyces sp. SID11726]NEB23273.1 ferredoxin reductase [Streptomyces sp. SID6673]
MSIRIPSLVGPIVEAALSPHPVDRYLELFDPMLTWRDLRGKVVAVHRPTDRSVRIVLRPTRQWKGHQAGQYVQLSTVIDGVRHVRCYSPANAAGSPAGDIELTITAHDDGFVSKHLRDHAHVGMVVGLSQATGEFTLPAQRPGSAVFISGGSGITPVLSMARTLVAENHPGPITFVHYARTPADVAYRGELTALASAYPAIDLRLHYTRGDGDGHFSGEHLDDIDGLDDAHLFVCGPPALMDAVNDHYDTTGMTQPLHSEAFVLASPIAVDPDAPIDGELTFLNSGRSATNDGRTILDQAESAGLSPESGCRMGICFSCTAIKKSGCTRNVLTGETDTEADKRIQLCINAPVGDVEIEV